MKELSVGQKKFLAELRRFIDRNLAAQYNGGCGYCRHFSLLGIRHGKGG